MNRRSFLIGLAATAAVATARIRFNISPDVEVRYIVRALAPKEATSLPVGTIIGFAGTSLPPGWLPCDGRAISADLFGDLFAVLGVAVPPRRWWQRPRRLHLPDWRVRMLPP